MDTDLKRDGMGGSYLMSGADGFFWLWGRGDKTSKAWIQSNR